jgi:enoyl-CoA hydratase
MGEGKARMSNLYDLPDQLRVEARGPIRLVTLNRPEERNPASTEMLFALTQLAHALDNDAEARAVIITGAGKAFSAGGDFQHLIRSSQDPALSRATLANARAFIVAMLGLRLPVIAAVNGAAVGFGATLAALCDIVLIADTAFIAEPHVNVGLIMGDGISVTWPLYMSLLKAKEYVLTGDRIPASAAVACGLANHVVAHADLLPEAMKLAQRLAQQPPEALQASKQLLNAYSKAMIESVLTPLLAQQFERTQSREHAAIVQQLIDAQRRNTS